jgi:uncharacterized protein
MRHARPPTITINRRQLLVGTFLVSALPPQAKAQPAVPAAARALVDAAMAQIGVTTIYDPAYVRLVFPGGDVDMERGVCTDVVVRAYRRAFNFDLQRALNEDISRAFAAYPQRWRLNAPDPNIDHRRVPNLATFFTRRGAAKPVPANGSGWEAGDVVAQVIPGGRPHIGIVSDKRTPDGARPLVIHNIGRGTQIEDILDLFAVTGRYRFFPTQS